MPNFDGKVVLITGGSSGIGLTSALAFAGKGASIAIAARNPERGLLAEQQLKALGVPAAFFECDVTLAPQVEALLQQVLARFGRLDCAVNCAAIDAQPVPTHEMPCADASQMLSSDVLGVFHCMKYQLAAMLPQARGTIVNLSSVNGISGATGAAMYSAGKHAVLGLTRSTAREYIGRGIRINAVCPGATDTPRRARRDAHLNSEQVLAQQTALAHMIPIGRLARAAEIAAAIVWLSSDESSYVVGHGLVVDGGLQA